MHGLLWVCKILMNPHLLGGPCTVYFTVQRLKPLVLALECRAEADLCEFKVGPVYIASSRSGRATERDPVF